MVFASICEHASTASFFASTSSDQICLASSEHFTKINTTSEQWALQKFPLAAIPFSLHFTRWFIRVRPVPNFAIISRPEPKEFNSIFVTSRTCARCERSRIYEILSNGANFNENLSMRAIAKILRARASEHSSKCCEQIEQRAKFASTWKFLWPFDTPKKDRFRPFFLIGWETILLS